MLEKFLKGVLRVVKDLAHIAVYLALILVILFIIGYLSLNALSNSLTNRANTERLAYSLGYDHEVFPHLKKHNFFYEQIDGGDTGGWVVVYPLDPINKVRFLIKQRIQNKGVLDYTTIRCIKPTINTGWKILGSHLHYVNPPEGVRHHDDFKVHDSFNTYGSEEHIHTVEQACKEGKFIVLNDLSKYQGRHRYWAISEKENLLFSGYQIK